MMRARGAGGRCRPGEGAGGGTPPAQPGSMGKRCKLPHWGLGRSPRSQRFFPKTTQKKARPIKIKVVRS